MHVNKKFSIKNFNIVSYLTTLKFVDMDRFNTSNQYSLNTGNIGNSKSEKCSEQITCVFFSHLSVYLLYSFPNTATTVEHLPFGSHLPQSGFGGGDDTDSVRVHFLSTVTHALRQLVNQVINVIRWILIRVWELLRVQ